MTKSATTCTNIIIFNQVTRKHNYKWQDYLLLGVLSHCKHSGHLCTNECGRKDHINGYIANPLTSFNSFLYTSIGQRYIATSREQVLLIPQRLPMTNQYQSTLSLGYKYKQGNKTHVYSVIKTHSLQS